MYSYQIKIEIKKDKIDEFVEFLKSMLSKFREEEGCIDFDLYRDIEKENIYSVIAYWETQKTMEKHFKRKSFSVLIGSTKVLGRNLEMRIGETSQSGNSTLAREKLELQPKKEANSFDEVIRNHQESLAGNDQVEGDSRQTDR